MDGGDSPGPEGGVKKWSESKVGGITPFSFILLNNVSSLLDQVNEVKVISVM